MPGLLSIVATPIGCLGDITLRALETLKSADRILAEDTRHTRVLLNHYEIGTHTESFHEHSSESRVEALVKALLEGAHMALVSDAGMPLLSDPGSRLVEAATAAGVRVETLPGASAITSALVVSALPCTEFRFIGFLPRGGSERDRALARIATDPGTTVLFESPRRLAKTLEDLAERLGERRRLAVCRELTKLHEEVARGTAAELLARFADGARGEITLVIEGDDGSSAAAEAAPTDVDSVLTELLARDLGAKEIAHELARITGLPRREAYRRVVERRAEG